MTLRARLLPPEDFIRGRNDNKNPATRRGLCPTIMDGQNVTPQNAPGSTIGNLGGVLPPPRMPIFSFIGQPASYRELSSSIRTSKNTRNYNE
ncbi:MAG TPA: hypothetical protein VFF49_03750 [Thermodesulfobacteriota bacterium]|nr:hypothetical protein [Thermodesulfobacteriota bacterium]